MTVDRVSTPRRTGGHHSGERLAIEHYVPYQLASLSSRLGLALERVCKRMFDLTRNEWRVLALVGQFDSCAASKLVERSVMDAVAIHRAVKRLESLGYLQRAESKHDMRVRPMSLTPAGRDVYSAVVPLAMELEDRLLRALPPSLVSPFKEALQHLTATDPEFHLPDVLPAK